jgi:N-acetylmuramoyl-L-alanine amidase
VAPSNRLAEKDANLAVALGLRDMLEGAGARVVLTREADVALADTLGADLSARAAMAAAAGAQVFVSVHHNADINPEAGRDDLEVYYKLGEPGPSLDLAEALTHALAERLRRNASAKRLLPGNYRVLRDSAVPAVLLESAYLTHAPSAAWLATREGVRREAEAIAAGLARYFAMDPPAVRLADAAELPSGHHRLVFAVRSGRHGNPAAATPLEPTTLRALVNGHRAEARITPGAGRVEVVLAERLANGSHAVHLKGRNVRGAAFVADVPVMVKRRAVAATALLHGPRPAASGATTTLEVRAFDQYGYAPADLGSVRLGPADVAGDWSQGAAWFLLDADDWSRLATTELHVAADGWRLLLPPLSAIPVADGTMTRAVRVVDADTGTTVAGARVTTPGNAAALSLANGWTPIGEGAADALVEAPGYISRRVALRGPTTVCPLVPVAEGALHGRQLAIDPMHGGRQPGATSPLGLRASDANRRVAETLEGLLRAAGAHVLLMREGDAEVSEPQRVAQATDAGAELYIAISHGMPRETARVLGAGGYQETPPPRYVAHYYGSSNGRRLAQAIAERMAGAEVRETAAYVAQQTACPAVIVHPATAPGEDRIGVERRTADAIYAAVLSYFNR